MTTREKVIEEVMAEREYQDHRWGGSEHDKNHTCDEWACFLMKYLGKFADNEPNSATEAHHRLIQIAAIAVAAAEQIKI